MFGDIKTVNSINKVIKLSKSRKFNKAKIIYCPPYTLLDNFVQKLKKTNIEVGAQNCHQSSCSGPFTGFINSKMIKNLGCKYVIIGHSESRNSGDTDLLINKKINDLNLIKSALEKKEKKLISIKVATKGNALKLSKMAEKNAKEALTRRIFESETNTKLLDQIAEKFQLNILPRVVEVYDNSHIQGSHSVGALISFGAEGFIKKRYRKFNIKNTNLNSGDDYGMLKEVLERRFSKIIQNKNLPDVIIPDLILIDGGKGQYSVSRKVLDDYGFHDIPIIAIAKGKNRNQGDETFIHKTNGIKLNKREPLLFFLQRLRDEAHRFAVSSHRIKRKKSLSKSLLDEINGIGRTRKRALLNYFGSAKAVESASFDDLKKVEGVETSVAQKIHDFFHS